MKSFLVCSFVVLALLSTLFYGQAQGASSLTRLKRVLFDHDANKVSQLKGDLYVCNQKKDAKLQNATDYDSLVIEPIREEIAQKNQTVKVIEAQIQALIKELEKESKLIGSELQLIEQIKQLVSNLNDADGKKDSILELLDLILGRIRSQSYLDDRYSILHAKKVQPLEDEKSTILSSIQDKFGELSAAVQWYESLMALYQSKKESCLAIEEELNDLLKKLKDEYDALLHPEFEVPEGRQRVVGQFVSPGLIRSFDGLNVTLSDSKSEFGVSNYVFFHTPDQSFTVIGHSLPVKYSDDSQTIGETLSQIYIRYKQPYPLDPVTIRIDEQGQVLLGGSKLQLPHYSQSMTIEKSSDGSVYIDFETEASVIVRSLPGSIGKDLSVILPRNLHYGNTEGLFGIFDDNHGNDLFTSTKEYMSSTDDLSKFVDSWDFSKSDIDINLPSTAFKTTDSPDYVASSAEHLEEMSNIAVEEFTAHKRSDQFSGNGAVCRSTGDPHYTTFDGYNHDMYGLGVYLLAKSVTGEMEIQTATKRWRAASGNEAVAARIHGDIVVIDSSQVLLNRQKVESIPTSGLDLPGGGVLTYSSNTFELSWLDGTVLTIHRFTNTLGSYMNVWVYAPYNRFNRFQTISLCGSFCIDPSKDSSVNMRQETRVEGTTLFDLGAEVPYSFEDDEDHGKDLVLQPSNPLWGTAKQFCESLESDRCLDHQHLDDAGILDCQRDYVILEGDENIITELYINRIEEDCRIRRTRVEVEPVLHLSFNRPFEEYPPLTQYSTAQIDLEHNHLQIPELDAKAKYALSRGISHGDMSLAIWLKLSDVKGDQQIVVRQNHYWHLRVSDDGQYGTYQVTFIADFYNSPYGVNINIPRRQWAHLVISLDGLQRTLTAWLDRERIGTLPISEDHGSLKTIEGETELVFGEGNFVARLKEMYLYDVPLNQEMVNRIYSDGHKIYSGMSNSLEKFIEELRDMIEFHDIQFYNETLPALKSERRALEQQVSEQTDLITSLNGQQNDLIEKRSIFKTQLGVKSSNISHLEQEITNTQNNCIDYKTQHIAIFNEELMLIQKIEDYVKEHKGLREEQNSPIHEESYSILDLLKQIKERIQGSISRNNDAIDECSNKIDQMNNEIEQIESEISSLEGEVSNVQTSLSSIADQISDANNHINQLNNEISELDSEIASAIEAHENWKAEQEAIIANFEETIAQNNPSLLQDGGQYLGSSVIDYTRGDSIKLLNLFEYIEVENPGDYFPILSRVQHSSASMYAQNIISPFYTEFSVAMEDTYWANFRTEITHLLVVACGDVHCNTLTFYLSIDATNAGFDCLDYLLPLNLHEPHIFSVPNQHCTSTFPMQIGDENVPTYLGIDDIDLVVAKYIVFARLS